MLSYAWERILKLAPTLAAGTTSDEALTPNLTKKGQRLARRVPRCDSRQLASSGFSGSLHCFGQHVLGRATWCTGELQRPFDLLAVLWCKLCEDEQSDDLSRGRQFERSGQSPN